MQFCSDIYNIILFIKFWHLTRVNICLSNNMNNNIEVYFYGCCHHCFIHIHHIWWARTFAKFRTANFYNSGIERDKTVADKVMYISNDGIQECHFCRLELVINYCKTLGTCVINSPLSSLSLILITITITIIIQL